MDGYVAYGAGFYGRCALMEYGFDSIKCFCDTYINDQEYVYGKKLVSIDEIEQTEKILICVADHSSRREIENILKMRSYEYHLYNPNSNIVKIFQQNKKIQTLLESNERMTYLLELQNGFDTHEIEKKDVFYLRNIYCKLMADLEDV